jgi:hypothetical protein
MRRDRDGVAGGGLLIYVRDGIGISRIRNLETPLDTISMFGFTLCKTVSEATRNVHLKLVSSISKILVQERL